LIERATLAEERAGILQPGEDGSISFTAKAHEIMSFRLNP